MSPDIETDLKRELGKQREQAITGPFSTIRCSLYIVDNSWDALLEPDVWRK
jgi:hypothetical protein